MGRDVEREDISGFGSHIDKLQTSEMFITSPAPV